MDRLELAERRYKDIVSEQFAALPVVERFIQLPTQSLQVWLSQYVVSAIEEIYDRPRFRELAMWSSRVLAADAQTNERAAVDRVAEALRTAAQAMRRLAEFELVKRQLAVLAQSDGMPAGAEFLTAGMLAHVPYYLDQLESIGQRAWTDLVCIQDFFGPVGGMLVRESLPAGATDGMFVVSLQPSLFFVGDSITRCLLQRIKAWLSILTEARYVVHTALKSVRRSYDKQLATEQQAWDELQYSRSQVEQLCLTGPESHLRDACVTAVQVYAEFHSAPDLTWLGLKAPIVQQYRGRLRHNIFSGRDLETIDRIAGSLRELRLLYRDLSPDRSAMEEAIATGGLVLVDKASQRETYWEGELLSVDWFGYEKPWQLLRQLTMKARLAEVVSWHDLYPDGQPNSTMPNRWHRLKKLLPATLAKWVQPGGDVRTYRLALSFDRIHIFSDGSR